MRTSNRISSLVSGLLFSGALCAASLFPLPAAQAAVLRVKLDAPGPAHDGLSWATAYTAVQPAVNAAAPGDEVWVARGTYTGKIYLDAGVALYGGFAGFETSRDARNWTANVTVLDGGGSGSVVTVPASAPATTVLDGFTVRNGTGTPNAYGNPRGGGIFCGERSSPTFRNNTITANTALDTATNSYGRGGGIFFVDLGAPLIANNTFSNNRANGSGAIYVGRADAQIIGNVFQDNAAEGPGASAGAVYISNYADALVLGNLFRHNIAAGNGGALSIDQNAEARVINNTFIANESQFGTGAAIHTYMSGTGEAPTQIIGNVLFDNASSGAALSTYGAVEVVNNTIVGTRAINGGVGAAIEYYTARGFGNNILAYNARGMYALPSGISPPGIFRNNNAYNNASGNYVGFSGAWNPTGTNGNISAHPQFVDEAGGNLHLMAASPCRDAGDNSLVPSGISQDIDGQPRIYGLQVDIGADEVTPVLAFTTTPRGARAGELLAQQPVVRALDIQGNPFASFNSPVTLSIKPGTGTAGAVLNGNRTVNAVNGTATFTDLSIDKAGAGYVLTATSAGLAGVDSDPLTIITARAYVSSSGDDAAEGATWATAKRTIPAAFAIVGPESEVWVAAGTYEGGIQIPARVRLYGGFEGRERSIEQRDPRAHETILEGSHGSVVSITSIVIGASGIVLDGFTIRGGVGRLIKEGTVTYRAGGGVYLSNVSATIANNVITHNTATLGAGIYANGAKPRIERNIIADNEAEANNTVPGGGGGIALNGCNGWVLSNIIVNNSSLGSTLTAMESRAGGIVDVNGTNVIRHNTISRNTSTDRSGGIDLVSAAPFVSSNIIAFNSGGVRADKTSNPEVTHNDVYSNKAYNWSGLPDQTGLNGNIDEDPRFLNADVGEFHLQPKSPCRDAGYADGVGGVVKGELDIDGQPRILGPATDIGADELAVLPIGLSDVLRALRLCGGLAASTPDDLARLNVEDIAATAVDLRDIARLARKAAGLDPNP